MTPRRRFVPAGILVVLPLIAAAIDLLVWRGGSELPGEHTQLRGGGTAPEMLIVAFVVIGYAALLLRRHNAVLAFAVVWLVSLVGLVVPHFQPFAGLLVGLYAVARHTPAPTSLIALMATAAPVVVNVVNTAGASQAPLADLLVMGALWFAFAMVGWGFGRAARVSAERQQVRERQLVRDAQEARVAERRQLSRELHDSVAGSITGMVMQAAGARALSERDAGAALDALDTIEASGVQALREMRRLLDLMRQESPDIAVESATLAQLDALVDQARAGGLSVSVHRLGFERTLDPSIDLAAYRVVQESFTNASKHSGQTAHVTLTLLWHGRGLTLTAVSTPDGDAPPVTADLPTSGTGLAGLSERLRLLGGSLSTLRDGRTFTVQAFLPASHPTPDEDGGEPASEQFPAPEAAADTKEPA